MSRYKNITDYDLTVIGVGVVKAGETVEAELIESPNFELVDKAPVAAPAPEQPAEQPAPAPQAPVAQVQVKTEGTD